MRHDPQPSSNRGRASCGEVESGRLHNRFRTGLIRQYQHLDSARRAFAGFSNHSRNLVVDVYRMELLIGNLSKCRQIGRRILNAFRADTWGPERAQLGRPDLWTDLPVPCRHTATSLSLNNEAGGRQFVTRNLIYMKFLY